MSTTPNVTTETTNSTTPAPGAQVTPSLGAVLAKALSAVKGKAAVATELAGLQTQITTLTGERDSARNERDQARTERDNAVAKFNAVASFFGIKPEELAGKDAAACSALFSSKLSDATLEQVASMGMPADQLPKQTKAEGAGAKTLTTEEFKALSHADRMKFSSEGGRISD